MQYFLDLVRWDKPIGTWLLFYPCSWSIVLAATNNNMATLPTLNLIALFFLGALIMRSAGCIINDIWDRNIDAQVDRTKSRPLASGKITIKQALTLLIILLICALIIVCQLRIEVFWLAFISLPMIAIYPAMKRITWWPQAFLGLTFNFGALMGWVAVTGQISLPAILLYISGIFWTLGYDTIYAFQDIKDDETIGVKSTAQKLQNHAKLSVGIFYTITAAAYLAALLICGVSNHILLISFLPLSALIIQLIKFNYDSKTDYAAIFRSNSLVGFLMLIPIIAHFLIK